MKKIIALLLSVILVFSCSIVAVSAETSKISEDLQQIMAETTNGDKIDVYLQIEPGIKYDGWYSMSLKRRVLKEMGLTSVPSWRDDPEGHRQFEALRYSMLMEDYNKNAVALLELLDVPEEDNLTPTGVTMYWHWRLTVAQINLADEQDCVIKMQSTDFDLDDDEEPDLEAEIQYKNKFEEWSVNKFGEVYLQDGYYFDELYTHYNGDKPDWVLCQAYYSISSPMITWLRIGGIGGRCIINNNWDYPFMTGYGVYDVNANEFYGLEDLAEAYVMHNNTGNSADKYDGLTDALAQLNIGCVTGDANGDNKLDILDTTFIQKIASGKAEIDYEDKYISDVNNDDRVDILDATAIQKALVA